MSQDHDDVPAIMLGYGLGVTTTIAATSIVIPLIRLLLS